MNQKIKVYTIVSKEDNEKNVLHTALGISDERKDELMAKLGDLADGKRDISEVIEEISKECVHANETSFCAFVVGFNASANMNPFHAITQLLGGHK